MKKFYSLVLAAATTLAAAAAPFTPVKEYTSKFKVAKGDVELKSEAVSSRAAGEEFPEELNTKAVSVDFTIHQKDNTGQYVDYPVTNNVTFTPIEEENGIQYYEMSNPFDGFYNETYVKCPAVEVGYDPATGKLYLIGEQTWFQYSEDGFATTEDFELWFMFTSEGNCFLGTYVMQYSGDTFSLALPFNVQFEGEDEPTVVDQCYSMILAAVNATTGKLESIARTSDFFRFKVAKATGEMKYTVTTDKGPSSVSEAITVSAQAETITINNFGGGLGDVAMTLDPIAHTLTANKQQLTGITKKRCYLSESINDYTTFACENAAGNKNYKLVCSYVVNGDVTTVTVPDWNAFYSNFGTDESYLWPMSNTTITINGDIEAISLASIQDVKADMVEANGPVKYFNLQGIQLTEPAAGQVVIKVQGTTATKMVVR